MSPLIEDLLGFGFTALPTAAQGDCGLDVMAYWDGVDRTPNQWKSLRWKLELRSKDRRLIRSGTQFS
jgi:hypothetical protein